MLSSLESYNFYTRDKVATYNRISGDSIISREATYYNENIKTVSTVEEFMDDDRLYNYAMKSYGLEEMTYAKGLIKKVLESNLTDSDSFANRLSDVRYKELAAAFDFGLTTQDRSVQTDEQRDDLIDTYTTSIQNLNKNIQEDHRYFEAVINDVTDIDQIFRYPRLRDYIFESFGIDPESYDYDSIKNILTSDSEDSNNFVVTEYDTKAADWEARKTQLEDERLPVRNRISAANTAGVAPNPVDIKLITELDSQIVIYGTYIEKVASYHKMSEIFNFQADGTLAADTKAITGDSLKDLKERYVLAQPRLTYSTALVNKTHYEDTLATFVTQNESGTERGVIDILYDPRMREMVFASFDISEGYNDTDLQNAIYWYQTDPGGDDFVALAEGLQNFAKAFDVNADGTFIVGTPPQSEENLEATMQGYLANYNKGDLAKDESLIDGFKTFMPYTTNLDDFLSNALAAERVRSFALTAYGIEEGELSIRELRAVLKSDVGDPNSFVNQSGDERFKKLAKSFNFDAQGEITTPRSAQSENELTRITKAYYIEKTRFDSSDSTKETANDEIDYYRTEIAKIDTIDELVNNQRLIDFLAASERLDSATLQPDFLKELFMSDPNDPDSVLNQQTDVRIKKIYGSFNFNENGTVASSRTTGVQNNRGLAETQNFFITQSIEEEAGSDSLGARLALYFERKATTISSLFEIIADPALGDFMRTALAIPAEAAASDVDAQVAQMERYITPEELQKPEKIQELVTKFLALYDIQNGASDPILGAFSGIRSFNAETLASFAQLRSRG